MNAPERISCGRCTAPAPGDNSTHGLCERCFALERQMENIDQSALERQIEAINKIKDLEVHLMLAETCITAIELQLFGDNQQRSRDDIQMAIWDLQEQVKNK